MNDAEDCSVPDHERECGGMQDGQKSERTVTPVDVPIEAEIAWNAFDRRWVTMTRVINGILGTGAAIAIVVVVYLFVRQMPDWFGYRWMVIIGAWGVGGGIIAMGLLYPGLAYRRMRFRHSSLGLEIQRGIFWRHCLAIPVSRIQHADVAQGPLERALGLGRLIIYTAGTNHSAVEMPALSLELAGRLRDSILAGRGMIDGV